jgi:hypothetical protein
MIQVTEYLKESNNSQIPQKSVLSSLLYFYSEIIHLEKYHVSKLKHMLVNK